MWFVFAVVTMLCWGTADVFYKKSSDSDDGSSHLKLAVWVGIVMGVCALALIPFAEHGAGVLNLSNIAKYAPASLSYIISMVVGYAGMRYMEISVISPVQNASGAFSAICMILWAVAVSEDKLDAVSDAVGLVFGEKTGLQSLNNALIFFGMIFVCIGVVALGIIEQRLSKSELDKENKKHRLGLLAFVFPLTYCLFDTVGTAADGIILDEKYGMDLGEIDVIILYGMTFFAAGLGCWIYMLIRDKKPYNPFSDVKTKGVAACFEEAGQVFYVYAMAGRGVIAAPMITSYCIVSVLLSRIFLKEKLTKPQYGMVCAVVLGILMLGVSEGISQI